MCHKHSPFPNPRSDPPKWPKMGVFRDPEKGGQTVPTGRVIKYPKKCALFAPPGNPPRGGVPGCQNAPNSGPLLGGSIGKYNVQVVRRAAHSGLPGPRFRVRFSARFGTRRGTPPGTRISGISGFPEFPPGRDPAPDPPSRGVSQGGRLGPDLAGCSRSYNHSTASSTPAVAVRVSYGHVSQA